MSKQLRELQARKSTLVKEARALTDRPALKMTVVGTASLDAEREAYKQERLRALLAEFGLTDLLQSRFSGLDAAVAPDPAS